MKKILIPLLIWWLLINNLAYAQVFNNTYLNDRAQKWQWFLPSVVEFDDNTNCDSNNCTEDYIRTYYASETTNKWNKWYVRKRTDWAFVNVWEKNLATTYNYPYKGYSDDWQTPQEYLWLTTNIDDMKYLHSNLQFVGRQFDWPKYIWNWIQTSMYWKPEKSFDNWLTPTESTVWKVYYKNWKWEKLLPDNLARKDETAEWKTLKFSLRAIRNTNQAQKNYWLFMRFNEPFNYVNKDTNNDSLQYTYKMDLWSFPWKEVSSNYWWAILLWSSQLFLHPWLYWTQKDLQRWYRPQVSFLLPFTNMKSKAWNWWSLWWKHSSILYNPSANPITVVNTSNHWSIAYNVDEQVQWWENTVKWDADYDKINWEHYTQWAYSFTFNPDSVKNQLLSPNSNYLMNPDWNVVKIDNRYAYFWDIWFCWDWKIQEEWWEQCDWSKDCNFACKKWPLACWDWKIQEEYWEECDYKIYEDQWLVWDENPCYSLSDEDKEAAMLYWEEFIDNLTKEVEGYDTVDFAPRDVCTYKVPTWKIDVKFSTSNPNQKQLDTELDYDWSNYNQYYVTYKSPNINPDLIIKINNNIWVLDNPFIWNHSTLIWDKLNKELNNDSKNVLFNWILFNKDAKINWYNIINKTDNQSELPQSLNNLTCTITAKITDANSKLTNVVLNISDKTTSVSPNQQYKLDVSWWNGNISTQNILWVQKKWIFNYTYPSAWTFNIIWNITRLSDWLQAKTPCKVSITHEWVCTTVVSEKPTLPPWTVEQQNKSMIESNTAIYSF